MGFLRILRRVRVTRVIYALPEFCDGRGFVRLQDKRVPEAAERSIRTKTARQHSERMT